MRLRALRVAGMLVGLVMIAAACSSNNDNNEWTTVNLDGEVRTGDGPTFHPGERLLLQLPATCDPPGSLGVTLWQKHLRNNSGPGSDSYLLYQVTMWFKPHSAADSVRFVLPDTIVDGTYELSADCGLPGDDTPTFYGRWDVLVVGGQSAERRGGGLPRASLVEERKVRLTGVKEYLTPDQDSLSSVLCLMPVNATEKCGEESVFYYSIQIDVIPNRGDSGNLGLPEESMVEVVLPDEIPPGEYLMTPGPNGEDNPVMISLGEP